RSVIRFLRNNKWIQKPFFFFFGFLRYMFPLEFFILKEGINSKSYLDLGCGKHSFTAILPRDTYSVGVDVFTPYIEENKKAQRHTEYIEADLRKFSIDRKFDTVFLLDVIEHLDREDGFALLKNMESWAYKRIMVSTPSGFMPLDIERNNNKYEVHKSGWRKSDFIDLGYNVTEVNNKLFCIKNMSEL
ncbi:MAG: class I SAM-dependent methyltransferase, partial [Candidatus Omnitrophota bacterium]